MIFNSAAAFGCHFIRIKNDSRDSDFHYGFWKAEGENNACISYRATDTDVDSPLKFGMACGFFIGLFGYPVMLALIFSTFIELPKIVKLATWILMYVLTFLTLMLFVGFASDDFCGDAKNVNGIECVPGAGAILNILAIPLWITAAIFFMLLQTPDEAAASKTKEGNVEVTEEDNGDGTKTRVTTTSSYNADGSKNITTKTEVIGEDTSAKEQAEAVEVADC